MVVRAALAPLRRWDPERIGPYLLLGRLGAGAMGQVFLGRSTAGRLVYPRHAHRHTKYPGDRPLHMGTERRGRGMDVQNAANGHPGLPACG